MKTFVRISYLYLFLGRTQKSCYLSAFLGFVLSGGNIAVFSGSCMLNFLGRVQHTLILLLLLLLFAANIAIGGTF